MSARPARAEAPGEDWSGAALADLAVACLGAEVEAWPKPGLVSRVDSGSHADMDVETFRRSAAALRPHFGRLAEAGRAGSPMGRLRAIGVAAEADMLFVTGGTNTHRGAVFGLGLLCAAAGRLSLLPWTGRRRPGEAGTDEGRPRGPGSPHPSSLRADTFSREREKGVPALGTLVASLWGPAILDGPVPLRSHGAEARRLYRAGGARAEAAAGFPTLYRTGLPALREGRRLAAGDAEAARVHACFALIASLEDTNILHRGGPEGLAFARREAAIFLDRGGVGAPGWRDDALRIHRAFVERRLSPGGSADLLAMTLFVDAMDTP